MCIRIDVYSNIIISCTLIFFTGISELFYNILDLSEAEAVQRAKEDGVRVYGLERYCIGAAADPAQGGTVLLGYAGLSEEEIAEAAAILKKCWNA